MPFSPRSIYLTPLVMVKKLQSSLYLSILTIVACLLAFFIHVLVFCFTANDAIIYNPLISGFLHRDWEHFGWNILILFTFLLHSANVQFNFKQLFIINLAINSIYYPLVVLGVMPFAIGLSGCCNFFISRALLCSNPVYMCLFVVIAIFELIHVFKPDSTAHLVHLIGLLIGAFSVRYKLWL